MCGIAGIINLDGSEVREEQICRMIRPMKHRGPDDEGMFREKGVGLGFVRLSIIDLSPAGHQPMFSQDERFVIVFNGEIYNYLELREDLKKLGFSFRTRTDTEVLLCAYQAWGEAMLHRLNGMWAFVIYDREAQELFGARDRYGIKPFYYSIDEGRVIFASEIPPILAVLEKKPGADLHSIFDYLVFNRTDQSGRTFFEEVKKLGHGCCFRRAPRRAGARQEEGLAIRRWYDLRSELKPPFRNGEEFRELLSSSIGLRLRSDVPVGVCLSGGLDSSSIVSILLKDYRQDGLNTFSAVYGAGKYGDESEFINLFRPKLQKMHFIQPDEQTLMADIGPFIQAHAEPVPTTGPYAQFKVMELAKGHVTVTLDGQGADEALAGYHYFYGFYFKDLLRRGKLGKLLSEMGHYAAKHRALLGIKSFAFFLLSEAWRTRLRVMEKKYLQPDFFHAFASHAHTVPGELYGSPSLGEALINHFEYKLEHLLKWEDRNSMWHSIEARVPFLDYRLVERALPLPGEWIIEKGMTKHILREAMRGTLPEAIRMRRDKMGFGTPQDEWFRAPAWRKLVLETLNSPEFKGRGLVDTSKAQDLFKRHGEGKTNISKEIWKWIHLEEWFRQFVD
ncbi:MAG: asparagine synthase (glutamine-hydrolyzing) [Phaeodactylibacter sp.]|nr:asparagine synthase (glutamine-hydrolyzing) [Phaeodactylibacter sp.]MCB9292753.1 asparagine synthase (glutamine-hydrolyzing) [Lewinellaceae bacterium]